MRDIDSGAAAQRIQLAAWSLVVAAIGAAIGVRLAPAFGTTAVVAAVGGALLGSSLMYLIGWRFASAAADAVASIFAPSGSSTPALREYSLAESLVVRGQFEEAIRLYLEHGEKDVKDAEPYVRIARIYRDRLERPEDAATAFRESLTRAEQPGHEQAIARELAELLIHRMNDPRRSMPILARLAERYPASPTGSWARTELAEIKRQLQRQSEG